MSDMIFDLTSREPSTQCFITISQFNLRRDFWKAIYIFFNFSQSVCNNNNGVVCHVEFPIVTKDPKIVKYKIINSPVKFGFNKLSQKIGKPNK
jgi:hypothetical protein